MSLWSARAGSAERAVRARHLHRLWRLPGTLLGKVAWPAGLRQRLHCEPWHYWWQAHLLDCQLDALLRDPTQARHTDVQRLVRGIVLRNLRRGWVNDFYDDVAWLGLALQRAGAAGLHHDDGLDVIRRRLHQGWAEPGGIWWHVGSDFKNAPTNGPAAILLTRLGDVDLATRAAEWIERHLVDPETGLVWDGVRIDANGDVRTVEQHVYTYCQGVYLGACIELAVTTGHEVWTQRARRTIAAVNALLSDRDGVLRTHGGGDGGLFTGILARYLVLAALRLPGESQPDRIARQLAADLVLASATAAWRHRTVTTGGPLFGADWTAPARPPARGNAERDLSVQLGGWMLCEAAAAVERSRPELL